MKTHREARATTITLTISALLGIGLLAGCGGSGSGSGSGTSAATAAQPVATAVALSAPALLHAAQAAVRSGGSVHIDLHLSEKNIFTVYSEDSAATGGRQVITVQKTGHMTILLIQGVGYVQANLPAMEGFFGLPQLQAGQYAGKWIVIRPGEKLGESTYDDITAGITLQSVASGQMAEGSPLSLVKPTTIDGQPVDGLQAPAAASNALPASVQQVLYVSDNSMRRPVLIQWHGGGVTGSVSFSKWHETLRLTAPADPTPASLVTPDSPLA
jgi:hypothetical protein